MSNRAIDRALQDIRRGMGCRLAANRHRLPLNDLKAAARKAGLGDNEHAKDVPHPPIRFRWRRRRVRFRLKGPIPPVPSDKSFRERYEAARRESGDNMPMAELPRNAEAGGDS